MSPLPDLTPKGVLARPYRVTVVCWGNICRSPMGEFMLREAFEEAGLAHRVVVDSAGTSTDELGRAMDSRTIAAMHRHGVRDTGFSAKRARQFRPDAFDHSDLILAADHVHHDILRKRARSEEEEGRVHMLRSFDPKSAREGTLGMDDPWYGSDDDFDVTYAEIAAAVPGIVDYVRTQLS